MEPKSFAERHPALVLTAASVVGLAAALFLLEVAVRVLFPSINFLDTDARLFVMNRFGPTHGNASNFRGISFGAAVATDASGFRSVAVPAGAATGNSPTILLLGDSVSFGVGVPEGQTFADLLAQRLPGERILNISSIGYDIEDYRSVVDRFVLPNRDRLNIRRVVLGYCLNDLSPRSREAIADRAVAPAAPVAYLSPEPQKYQGLAAWFHAQAPFVNDWLRSRSKLFLLVKAKLVDAGRGYFMADYALYRDDTAVSNLLARLLAMSRTLERAGIGFSVVIFPYEYQLRTPQPESFLPQRRLVDFLRQNGVPVVDLSEAFLEDMRRAGRSSKDYFLFNDPMHLSAVGHRATADALADAKIAGPDAASGAR